MIDEKKLLRELNFVAGHLPCGIEGTTEELKKWIEKQPQIEETVIMNFAVAVLDEVNECAKQEDSPIYKGDREDDYFVRLSDVNAAINKCLTELVN